MMPTTREFLGDSLIKELEGAGFSPQSINAFAKNEYRQRKAAQEEEQRRLLYRADDMKLDGKTKEAFLSGDINEQEAKNAQKFEEFGAKKHGFALGAAKTVTGIANTVERVGDFINPFYEGKRDKDGNYIYQNGLEKSLRPKIKNVEKMRDDYEKATGETSWGSRLAEIGTELVGDPINFIGGAGLLSKGSKLAQFGKKTLYFAGTGAASGGVAALGEGKNDEETLKNIGYGAAGGFFLGHAIDQGIQGISKLIAKRQANKAAKEADAIESAENSEFLNTEQAEINTAPARKGEPSSSAETMTAREFATKEIGLDEDTATNVLKEAMQGKEKSEFIDADSYNDIVKFKNFEVQREYAKAYGKKLQTAQASINNAREQSAIRYADTQKAISEYQKQGMSASATRELINAKFKPSADEINYTRAYNDGADVDARLAGQGIFYALEKDIAAQAYTPEIYATRLKQRGFSDESVQAFTQAYVSKDINVAKEYVNSKVADAYESRVQREAANEIKAKNQVEDVGLAVKDGEVIDKPEIYEGNSIMDFSSKIDDNFLRENATELEPSGNLFDFLAKTKNNPSRDKILNHFADKAGEGDSKLLEHRMAYLNYIMPTIKEPLIKIFRSDGRISNIKPFVFTDANSKTKNVNFLSIVTDKEGNIDFITAYALKDKSQLRSEIKKGIKIEVRRGLARTFDPHSRIQVPNATDEIISQKGNLINEEAKNSTLPNGVSGIGDNASRAGGRQGGDEEILRQSGRDTSSASQTKQTAQSDEQMEQRPAFKTDGDTDATASSKQMVEEQGSGDNEIKGENFITKESPAPKSDLNVKMDLAPNVRDLSKITVDEISADLDYLASKHPEMFSKPSDVFRLIREIKNEPTHFFNNYRLDYALVAKRLNDKKIGKLAINKESGEVRHATKVRERDLSRMDRVSKQMAGTSTLPTPLSTANNSVLKQDATSAGKAYSSADKSIIPQKDKNTKTINANSHIASGFFGGTLNSIDEDGNFNPDRFAAGFLAGLAGSKAVAITTKKMTPQLYNKILGTAKKMPQMAKDNPKLLGKLYANGKDVSLNSFAGEKAITANVGKLDQAKAMLEKGADEVEIWQKTGWFKDKDGAWKFEIGDSKARLNPNFKSGGRLGELLEHEELFKAYPELEDVRVVKIGDAIPQDAAYSVKDVAQKEKRGIYNVAYNDKTATLVRQDLQKIDDALMFEKGSSKKGGAIHIKKHLEPEAQGAITQSELLNIGKNIREYLQKYKEPFIDEHGGRIYEWANKEGEKFRVVVYEKIDGISASHPETIISFYSNRNLKKPMEFRNPEVKYDVNLRQWHKDSAPITKNADGSPKVFYHGSKARDIAEFKDEFDKTGVGFWFSPNKNTADEYGDTLSVYLKAKKIMDFAEPTKKDMEVLKLIQEKMFWSGHIKLRETNNEPLFRVMLDIFRKNGVELKQLLKERGYDGIRVNKDMFVVFDSTQIKHVKNNGNFSDSPNIYKSGKEGYYSPAKNEIGLSDLGDKSTLMHEVQHAIQEIEDFARGSGEKGESYRLSHGEAEARNVQNRLNLDNKAYPHETFDVNPNKTIVSKDGMINLSHELEKKYILKDGSINEAAVRKEAEPFIEKEYSLENFKAEFPNGKVDTPIGEVAVSNYQFEKLNFKGREKYLGLIKPTLERPAFVVDFEDTTFFFKPFRDKDGVIKFASVIKERDGGLDVTSNYPMANRKFELITREGKVRYVQGSVVVRPLEHSLDNNIQGSAAKSPIEHSLDDTVRSSGGLKPIEHSSDDAIQGSVAKPVEHSLDGDDIIARNEEKIYHSRKIEEIKREHPNIEKELDESIAAMRKESFNSSNFKDGLISKIGAKDITTKQLGKSIDLSDKQLAVLKNDIKNADFKAISDSKIYFDKMGKNGDKKRFFIDITEDGNIRVDAYAKSQIDNMPIKENALQELAGVGDRARLKNMSFEVKAAYRNELDPIKKEAILKRAELNKLKKAAQGGDKVAVAKFEEFKAKNLDKDGNIKDGLRLC